MVQQTSRKRRQGATGVKALIASASVAATLAGWAILPANDPQAAQASDQSNQPPALSVPDTSGNNDNGGQNTFPQFQNPDTQSPQPFSAGGLRPFTRSHSSR